MRRLLLASLMVCCATSAHAQCAYDARTMGVEGEGCPQKVVEIVERSKACDHFMSEPFDDTPEGQQRRAFLEVAVAELDCAGLEADQQALQEHYGDDEAIVTFLRDHVSY